MNVARLAAALVILGSLSTLLFWTTCGQRARDSRGVRQEPGIAEGAEAAATRDPGGLGPEAVESRERAGHGDSLLLQGRVTSDVGGPLPGALVRWVVLQKEDLEPNPAWPGGDWGVAPRAACETRTDPGGRFSFGVELARETPFGAVVVALHEEHYPGGIDLEADRSTWPGVVELVLQRARPLSVRVVSGSGEPVASADVHHVAGQPRDPTAAPLFERFLAQVTRTDAAGEAGLAPFKGAQVLWAEQSSLRSPTWQGTEPVQPVTLRLGAAFTIGGTIAFPDKGEWKPDYEGERRVIVSAWIGNRWRAVARLRDVQEGEWGPLTVPLEGALRFRVRLEGVPITPLDEEFAPPAAGGHRRIDFSAERNAELYLLVVDERDQPITNAHALLSWGPTESDSGVHQLEGASRPDGYLYLGTFPPGTVRVQVTAPGHGFANVEAVAPAGHSVRVVLPRSAVLEGRCVYRGEPASEFEVVYWQGGDPREHRIRAFSERADGRFALEDVWPGDWSIHAASATCPSGPLKTVRIQVGQGSRVELELTDPLLGGGRVLDAATGLPIPDSLVQVYSSGGMGKTVPWGLPVAVSPDGSFELEAFVPGTNFIAVSAAGYGAREVRTAAKTDGLVDWGDIRLHRTQALELQLHGLEEAGLDAGEIVVSTDGEPLLPSQRVEVGGRVRYERVAPGEYQVLLNYPDLSWDRLHLRLDSGGAWNFEHRVGGSRRVEVVVLDAQGTPEPIEGQVVIASQESQGLVVRGRRLDRRASATFAGIAADQAQVLLAAPSGAILLTKDVELSDDPMPVELRLGTEPMRVRVVDPEGAPLSGAWVTVRSRDGARLIFVDDTNADGLAELAGVPKGPVMLDLKHGVAGRRMGIPIEATSEVVELVLEARGTLALRLSDGELALAGVSVRMETAAGTALSEVVQTSSEGVARFEAMGAGSVRLACHRSDCWPVVVERALDGEGVTTWDVQMRRLGDVLLSLRNRDGLPVAGFELSLRSLELDADVAGWIAEKRIRARGGLVTDALGQLSLEGLPRGTYSWSAGNASGGNFEVRAGERSAATVFLPE